MLLASAAVLVAVPAYVLGGRPEAAAGSLEEIVAAPAPPPTPSPSPAGGPVAGEAKPYVGERPHAIRTRSARLADLSRERPRRPVSVRIPALGVTAPVRRVGVHRGAVEVPGHARVVGWYAHGPSPGEPGSAVLVGHVDLDGTKGVFYKLRTLEPGAIVTVRLAGGGRRSFRVVARRSFPKNRLPAKLVFAQRGRSYLTLVTCGGDYDRASRSYADNVVVFAAPLRTPK